jgi:hypothetical protein
MERFMKRWTSKSAERCACKSPGEIDRKILGKTRGETARQKSVGRLAWRDWCGEIDAEMCAEIDADLLMKGLALRD